MSTGDDWKYSWPVSVERHFIQSPFSIPSPRMLPVNVPLPDYGVTIVTVDREGNTTIRVNQVEPT